MATVLSIGDIAIVHYNSSTDAFTFVFLRDVEAGTIVNFTDNGWLAAGGFRPGEETVTYTAPAAITAGTLITLTGLNLDGAGDQIIAYQGDPAAPTILHVIDFADGNNTIAGDATNDNTTALPPGFTLGINAVAVAFDSSLYAGPINGSAEGLFTALNNSANWLNGAALPVPFFFDARPTIDLDANNSSGAFGFDYLAFVGSGGSAVPIADTDVAINDADDFDLFAAQITIIGANSGDLLAITGSLPSGIVAQTYNPVTGVLRLDGAGLHADYETAIRQVRFSTTASPGDLKVIQVSVFDGFSWSHDTEALIHVVTSLGGAPPALDLDANNSTGGGADATATYAAGGPAIPVTDIDVRITDDGTTIQSATINILGWSLHPGDVLSIAGTLPTGITASSYNPFNGEMRLSGSASLADYQTALRQVVYSSTLSAPSTADRGIQVTVNDGSFNSNSATMYMHVVIPPPNIAPLLDLDANNSTTTGANYLTGFAEGGSPVAIADTDVSIFDSDSPNLASATITLTNPQTDDVLTFEGTPPTGITMSGSGTSIITLTGVALSGSYQTALRQITFDNSNVDPSNVTRTIEVVVSDGTSNSNTATALVQVEAVNNSAPVIDLDPDDSTGTVRTTFRTIFTENGTPTAIADTDTTITDLDSTTLVSATITLANQHPGDLLTVTLPLPGGIVASAYDPGTGVLTLTGVATLDDYEVALQQIRYSNDSDNPNTVDRLVEVVVSDGANTSNVAAAVIGVVPVNDPPVLVIDPSATYVENAVPTALSPLATLTGVDNTEATEAVVRITDGTIPGDGDTLTVGGLTNGTVNGITFVWHPTEHAMVLSGASLFANYQALLQTVEFSSTSDNPTDFDARTSRTLTWSVSDGADVTTATTTLNIIAVNDAPQATVAAAASYTENAAPAVLSPASTATDVDNSTLVAGEVRIVATAVDGDLLTVNGLQSGTFSGIDFSYDAVLHDLTFSGPTTVADYQAFLQAVAFSSTSDNPTNSGLSPTRTLSWFLFDGDAISDAQTTILTITALADPPVNTVPGAQSVNEDTLLPIAGVSVADVDGPTLTTTLTVTSGKLNVTAGAGVTGNGTAAVTIIGTTAQINTALAGLSYTGNLNFNGPDTLTVTTNDGTAQDIDTVAITVNPLADPPVNTVPGPQSVNEDVLLPIAGVSVADPDVGSLTTMLTVTSGKLNVTAGAGVTGNGTAAVTITGTAAQINTALAGLSYTGNLNFNGPDTLTVTTNDGATPPDIDTVAITVNPVNDPPTVPAPKILRVNEDTTLLIPGLSVSDVDSLSLTTSMEVTDGIINVTAGSGATINGNGTATITITGTVSQTNAALAGLSYRGNLNFNGEDFLFLTTRDEAFTRGTTILVMVEAVNDAPANTVPAAQSVNEDTLLPIGGVSVADVDSSTLTTTLTVTSGTLSVTAGLGVTGNGTATVTITGTAAQINTALAGLAYTGNLNFNGADTLTVTTGDGTAQNIDTIAITVNPVNDAPVNTVPGAQSVNEDTPLPIAGVSVADVDGPTLTTTLTVTSGTINVTDGPGVSNNGTATVTITGTAAEINTALAGLSYTGNLNFSGADTLTVTTDDGTAPPDIDTIAITVNPVNDAPVAQDGSASGDEDTPIDSTLVATDIDSPNLTYRLGTQAAHGTAVVNPDGTFTYTPAQDFNGTDSFAFIANDTAAGSNNATISLTIAAVNDAPVAQDGSATGNEDTPISGTLVATDIDSTILTYSLGTPAAHGAVVVNPDGSYTYTPNADFNGTDSFTFIANDSAADSNAATISLTIAAVNDAPVAQDGSASGNEDTPISGTLVATDIDSPNLTYRLGTQAAHGTAVVNPDGSFTYTPAQDFSGTDSFTFIANDTAANSNGATISLTIAAVNDPPVAQNGSASDGAADSNIATINLIVAAVNDPPVAQDGSASGAEDAAIAGTLVAADIDSEGLTFRLGTQAAHGTAVVNPDGSFTYTPSPDFNGIDSFTFLANDGAADSNAATVSLTVNPVNDPPVLDLDADDSTSGGTGYATTYVEGGAAVRIADTDIAISASALVSATITLTNPLPGDLLSVNGTLPGGVTAVYDPATGVMTLTGTAPAAAYQAASDQIVYSNSSHNPPTDDRIITVVVNDGISDSNTATAIVKVAAVNDAPHLDFDADDSTVPSTHFETTFAGTAVSISDTDVAIADPDNSTLASATIHLLIPNSGDLLSVNGALPAGISASAYDPATGILTLSGAASLADYQTAIHQVEFGTSGASPAPRMIEVTVNDGTLDSNAAVAVIDFAVPPEPPPVTVDPHWMATRQFTPHPDGWSPIVVADVAGDHMSDLIWRSDSTGSLDEWQIVNGNWGRSVDLGSHAGAGWLPASAGDFNGDGTDDIFWLEPASGNTDIWQMANGEHAASMSPGLHPTGFQVAGTGDFDGDGTSDVLWFNAQSGTVDIWKIVNGQWAGSVNPGPAPAGFSIAGTGDFNHDGSDDVVWFNPSSRDVQIWEMENGQIARSIDVGPHPEGYTIVGSADFTGDGTSDILWFNPTTGHVDLWKIQDSHWAGSVDIGPHPLGWQPIGVGDSDGNGIADLWWREGATSNVETWMLSIL